MEKNYDVKTQMRSKPALHMFHVELPTDFIDNINKYIDDELLDENYGKVKGNAELDYSYSDGLVGQIRQNEKSAQLDCKVLDGTDNAQLLKSTLDATSNEYLRQIGFGDSHADVFEAWTVHCYAGDYIPLHDHGCRTSAGLSMILYLKVPECIQKLPDPSEFGGGVDINHASGVVDGYTYFTWGNNNMRDVVALKPVTEEYVKPEKGTLIIFPNWLRHSVNPFFGEGERRTFSSNVNIFNKQNFKIKGKSFSEMSDEEKEGIVSQFRGRKKVNKVTGAEIKE